MPAWWNGIHTGLKIQRRKDYGFESRSWYQKGSTMIDIKRCVKNTVTFVRYHDMNLWYATVDGDEFPVPVEDIGNATFNASDKGIMFMRYMRKWNKELE